MRFGELTVTELLAGVAAKTPAPGGGAVAPIVAALGAALAQMVLRFSEGKKSLGGNEELHREAIIATQEFVSRAIDLAEADAKAYGELNALWKLDRDDPTRTAQWAGAVAAAIDVPMRIINECNDMLELFVRLQGKTNRMLDSDLAIAAVLAEAAARSAAWNVRINLPLLDDDAVAQRTRRNVREAIDRARAMCERIESAIGE